MRKFFCLFILFFCSYSCSTVDKSYEKKINNNLDVYRSSNFPIVAYNFHDKPEFNKNNDQYRTNKDLKSNNQNIIIDEKDLNTYRFSPIILISSIFLIFIFLLVKLNGKNKKIQYLEKKLDNLDLKVLTVIAEANKNEKLVQNKDIEIDHLKNDLFQVNSRFKEIKKQIDGGEPDNFLIYQIIELLRNISYYSDGQSDSDKNNFDLIKKEIESIINNSGAKEFNPIIGSSVLKDSDLAQRVLVKRKINIRKDSEPIGIIVEVLNKGYSDKNGEVLIKANVVVTARS